MKRYRVAIKNSKENRIELPFSDLCVHYSNGFSPILRIKEGEEVPLDVCDPEDLRKSWLVGSLRGYLENKWIEEISEDLIIKEATPISQFITEQMVLTPKVEPAKIVETQKVEVPPQKPNLPEVVKVEDKVVPIINEQITDLNLVKSQEDFSKLSHFLKLRFIKESSNIELLKQIQTITTSAQFKNNISLRLSTIK